MNNPDFHAVSDVCRAVGWPPVQVVASTGSTNDDLVGRGGHGQVLVALEQTAGKGRLDRHWVSRPGEGLTFSVRLDVPTSVGSLGWIPLLAGVAVADAVRATGAHDIAVKWPNDVLSGTGKLAGILSVADAGAVIVGIGINLDFTGDLPDPNAISLIAAGGVSDAPSLLAAVVEGLATWWQRFTQSGGDARRCGLYHAYRAQCVTLGAAVTVRAPGREFAGEAIDVDDQGALMVAVGEDVVAVTAGDVTLA